jgi:hypothetical protein
MDGPEQLQAIVRELWTDALARVVLARSSFTLAACRKTELGKNSHSLLKISLLTFGEAVFCDYRAMIQFETAEISSTRVAECLPPYTSYKSLASRWKLLSHMRGVPK